MKILIINNFHHLVGGAERYYFDLSDLLVKRGHSVAHFSVKNKKNIKSCWDRYFINPISFERKTLSLPYAIKVFARMFYSIEAKKNISKLLDVFKPDVVHLQNIGGYISPSILPEIKRRKIPVVMTVHDYSLLTPNINLFHNGTVCEVTKRKKYYKTFFHKCIENSYSASFASSIIYHLHDLMGIYDNVDCFLAPSKFMYKKIIEYGFPREKVVHMPSFIDISNLDITQALGDYVLYFGRLQEHKGVELIVEAAKKLPQVKFLVVGNGNEKQNLCKKAKISHLENIRFLRHQKTEKLIKLIRESRFTLVPSLWYENQPYSLMESFVLGKPVVGAKTGGIPEILVNKKEGLLFTAGDLSAFIKAILKLWKSDKLVQRMGVASRAKIINKYNSEAHYQKLMNIYQKAIDRNKDL